MKAQAMTAGSEALASQNYYQNGGAKVPLPKNMKAQAMTAFSSPNQGRNSKHMKAQAMTAGSEALASQNYYQNGGAKVPLPKNAKYKLTSARIEAGNISIGMVRKRARGLRDTEYFKLKIRQSSLPDEGSMFYVAA